MKVASASPSISAKSKYSLYRSISDKPYPVQAGLFNGSLGLVMVHACQAKTFADDEQKRQTGALYKRHFLQKEKFSSNHKFGYGQTGLAWTTQFLINEGLISQEHERFIEPIEEQLVAKLVIKSDYNAYNLPIGMLGTGVYFLERLKANPESKTAKKALMLIVDHLEKSSLRLGSRQLAWVDQYTSIYSVYRTGEPYFNLQYIHGISSIIVFLAHCYKHGIQTGKSLRMIEEAINWINLQQNFDGNYPEKIYLDADQDTGNNPMAWTENAIGIAMAFWVAAKVLNETKWQEKSVTLLKLTAETLRKSYSTFLSHVPDISFGKGSSGLAYIFHKFYRMSGDISIKKTADYWMEVCLENLEKSEIRTYLDKDQSIMSGTAGIMLTILSYQSLSKNAPAFGWDRMFLADIETFGEQHVKQPLSHAQHSSVS